MRPPPRGQKGRAVLLKYAVFPIIIVGVITLMHELRLAAQREMSLDGRLPASEQPTVYELGGSELANIRNWRGEAARKPPFQPTQAQKLAVLVPCWSDCSQASILILYLSSLLRQQGIPFRIYVFEQTGGAVFNPGLLIDIGFQAALKLDAGFVPDYVAFQRPNLLPLVNVSYAYPSSPFLHLAAEQSLFSNVLPYPTYCGGAWLATVPLFWELGGMSTAYAGYDGLEDDLCRRVLEQLGGGEVRRPEPGRGRFTVSDEGVLQELAAMHRERNRQAFSSRWGKGTSTTAAERLKDGLGGIPENWPQLLTVVQQGDTHGWWRVQIPTSYGAAHSRDGSAEQLD